MLCLASLPDCINALAGDTTVAETFVSDFEGEQGPAWRAHRYGVKIGSSCGQKGAVKSNAAFADATGVKGSEGQKSMVVVLSGGQVRGVKLPCAACPACSSRYRLSAVLIMQRLCCKRACGNRGGLTPCRSTGRERAHGRAEASQGQGQVVQGRQESKQGRQSQGWKSQLGTRPRDEILPEMQVSSDRFIQQHIVVRTT